MDVGTKAIIVVLLAAAMRLAAYFCLFLGALFLVKWVFVG